MFLVFAFCGNIFSAVFVLYTNMKTGLWQYPIYFNYGIATILTAVLTILKIRNLGDLQPGWTVKMVTRDRAGGVVGLVVAVVKRVTREKSSGYIKVTFTDYLDVNNTEGVVNTHTLRLCKGDLNDRECTCDGMFSHEMGIRFIYESGQGEEGCRAVYRGTGGRT